MSDLAEKLAPGTVNYELSLSPGELWCLQEVRRLVWDSRFGMLDLLLGVPLQADRHCIREQLLAELWGLA